MPPGRIGGLESIFLHGLDSMDYNFYFSIRFWTCKPLKLNVIHSI